MLKIQRCDTQKANGAIGAALDHELDKEKAPDEQNSEDRDEHVEISIDERLDGLAELEDQCREYEEPQPATQDRRNEEDREADAEDAGGDRDELVRNKVGNNPVGVVEAVAQLTR